MASISGGTLNLRAMGGEVSDLRILIRQMALYGNSSEAVQEKISKMISSDHFAPFKEGLHKLLNQGELFKFNIFSRKLDDQCIGLIKKLHDVFFNHPFIQRKNKECNLIISCPRTRSLPEQVSHPVDQLIHKDKMDLNLCLITMNEYGWEDQRLPRTAFEYKCQQSLAKQGDLYQTLKTLLIEGANPNDFILSHPLASIIENELLTWEEKEKLLQLMIDKGLDIKEFFCHFKYRLNMGANVECCSRISNISQKFLQLIFDAFEKNPDLIKNAEPYFKFIYNCDQCLHLVPIMIFNGIDVSKLAGDIHALTETEFLEARIEITAKALAIYEQAQKELPPSETSTLAMLKKVEALNSFSTDLLGMFSEYMNGDISRQIISRRCYELAKENPIVIPILFPKDPGHEAIKKN